MTELVDLRKVEVVQLGCDDPPRTALEYLQSIYRNPAEEDHRRLRAATLALPFESPKLAVTTTNIHLDFGDQLDLAINRSLNGPPKLIEGKYVQPTENDNEG
jgi:hypothetical protein